MSNRFYNSDTGVNWGNVADTAISTGIAGLTTGGVGALAAFGGSMIKGGVSDMFNRKSEKRAYANYKRQLQKEYEYAQMYAENSPSWTVAGLRKAGINPMLPFMGSSPSSPMPHGGSYAPSKSDTSSDVKYDPLTLENLKLLTQQNEGLRLDNELKEDTVKTVKSENEVRRLEAEAKAGVLRPDYHPFDNDKGVIGIYTHSEGFRALQKAIRDDYDLRSEKYIRETVDAVMKYGTDVLKLLPMFRRKELFETITKTTTKDKKGRVSTVESYTTHGPKK